MPSPTVIRVEVREVYGSKKLYPANTEAMALADIAGTVTLSPKILRIAKRQLGMDVQVEQRDAAYVASLIN